MDNDATKVDVRCRFALEKLISPDLYELFSQIPTSQHSKLILVMLERALCYEKQMGVFQNRPLIPAQPSVSLMARSNSPTLGHPKFPQAGPPDYDDSGATAMRAAASLRR